MQEPSLSAQQAAGLPSAPAATTGLQTITEKSSVGTPKQPDEDVFARSNPEEFMLGGHEREGGGTAGGATPSRGPPPSCSSLTEALAAEAVQAAEAAPRPPTVPSQVGCFAPTG